MLGNSNIISNIKYIDNETQKFYVETPTNLWK